MKNRWWQLVFGIVCLMAVSNLQYGWTLFVLPIDHKFGWGRPAIQFAFFLFVLVQTWLAPIQGYLTDRLGPSRMIFTAGVLAATAWVMNSYASSLPIFYVAAAIGGMAAGMVTVGITGNVLKWFPDKRGFAAGLSIAGFVGGSAFTVALLSSTIRSSGYESAFFWFGLAQGTIVMLAAMLLRAPRPDEVRVWAAPAVLQSGRDYKPTEVLRTAPFWVMYIMFVLVATGGLMLVAQLAVIARDFKVDTMSVSILGLTGSALTVALVIDRMTNALSRPFFGWVSDHIGRENTMFIAFLAEGISVYMLITFVHDPLLFVLFTVLAFFAWAEIFSLFPAICTDTYGRKYATTNWGMLYTAKGFAALFVPLASVIAIATGSWNTVFMMVVACDVIAAFMAILVLRPLRKRAIA